MDDFIFNQSDLLMFLLLFRLDSGWSLRSVRSAATSGNLFFVNTRCFALVSFFFPQRTSTDLLEINRRMMIFHCDGWWGTAHMELNLAVRLWQNTMCKTYIDCWTGFTPVKCPDHPTGLNWTTLTLKRPGSEFILLYYIFLVFVHARCIRYCCWL